MHKGRCGTQGNSSATFSHICIHVISTFHQGVAHFQRPESTVYASFQPKLPSPRQHYSALCHHQPGLPSPDSHIKGVIEDVTCRRWRVPDMAVMTLPVPLLTVGHRPSSHTAVEAVRLCWIWDGVCGSLDSKSTVGKMLCDPWVDQGNPTHVLPGPLALRTQPPCWEEAQAACGEAHERNHSPG